MTSPSRRDILKTSAAAAAGAALPSLGGVAPAIADPNSMSAAEIVAAIRDKKISATDVAKAAIARARQVKDLNALRLRRRRFNSRQGCVKRSRSSLRGAK